MDNLTTPKGGSKYTLPFKVDSNEMNWQEDRKKRKRILQEMYHLRMNK
mgnify:CR=1 FL=1